MKVLLPQIIAAILGITMCVGAAFKGDGFLSFFAFMSAFWAVDSILHQTVFKNLK